MRTIGGMPGRRLVCRNPFRAPAIYRLSYTMEEAEMLCATSTVSILDTFISAV